MAAGRIRRNMHVSHKESCKNIQTCRDARCITVVQCMYTDCSWSSKMPREYGIAPEDSKAAKEDKVRLFELFDEHVSEQHDEIATAARSSARKRKVRIRSSPLASVVVSRVQQMMIRS
jgi:hypothetical protein